MFINQMLFLVFLLTTLRKAELVDNVLYLIYKYIQAEFTKLGVLTNLFSYKVYFKFSYRLLRLDQFR